MRRDHMVIWLIFAHCKGSLRFSTCTIHFLLKNEKLRRPENHSESEENIYHWVLIYSNKFLNKWAFNYIINFEIADYFNLVRLNRSKSSFFTSHISYSSHDNISDLSININSKILKIFPLISFLFADKVSDKAKNDSVTEWMITDFFLFFSLVYYFRHYQYFLIPVLECQQNIIFHLFALWMLSNFKLLRHRCLFKRKYSVIIIPR